MAVNMSLTTVTRFLWCLLAINGMVPISALSSTSSSTTTTASNFFQLPRPVYIRSLGAFLPNDPVSNDELELHLGKIEGSPAMGMVKDKILALNGIETRYYAMKHEQPTHLSIDLAAQAALDAIHNSGGRLLQDITMLATGTTMPDVPTPGFANLVHGRLGANHSMDCLSSAGVCISSTSAMKAACNAIALGQHHSALVAGSEAASHGLHAKHQKRFILTDTNNNNPMSGLFLRYMLSDGAGCALLDSTPHPHQLSYRIDAFYHHSFAHQYPPCMIAGTKSGAGKRLELHDIYKFNEHEIEIALRLQQDIKLLKRNIIPLGKEALQYGIQHKGFPAENVDWVLPHLSSHMFLTQFQEQIYEALGISKDRIWTNLKHVGNVGAASMPLLLWGFLRDNPRVKQGDRVLVAIPESGNFSYHYILLTVV